jgi:hypothetical protein
MRESVREAVENGASLLDAVQQTEFVDWKEVRLHETNQRASAGFVNREMEQALFREQSLLFSPCYGYCPGQSHTIVREFLTG